MQIPARLYTLDVARGLAASAVVFWHWQHFYFDGRSRPADFDRARQPLYGGFRLLYDHGHLAVPFFFLLSGFVFFWLYHDRIRSRQCSVREFAILRFARLYPLHFATLILVIGLQLLYAIAIGGYFVYPHNDAYHFWLQTAFVSHWGFEQGESFNAPIWSVSIEVGLYALFFAFATVPLPRLLKLTAALGGALALCHLGIGGRWGPGILAFFMGGLTYECLTTYLGFRRRALDGLIVVAAVSAWVLVLMSPPAQYWLLTRKHACLVFLYPLTIAALAIIEINDAAIARRIRWIGDITYSSYLLHFPLQLLFVIALFGLGFDVTVFDSALTLIAFIAILLILSLLAYHHFERPAQRSLRALLMPLASSQPAPAPTLTTR